LPLPVRWLDGPDMVASRVGARAHESRGYFLAVTPDDNGLEVDRIAVIDLDDGAVCLDGESRQGRLLNQVIGLFDVENVRNAIRGSEFLPDRLFHGGKERSRSDLDPCLREYLSALGPLRVAAETRAHADAACRFNLCPAARLVIERYLDRAPGAGTAGV
jgi:hypothetical protein